MALIENTIATSGDAFKANRDGMLALIARMRLLEERTRTASAAAKDRFHKRGQLLPRERVALVLDPGSPFIELSTLAGYMFDVPDPDKSVPGGGVVAGIGFVSGIRCMVSANDAGIDAGALSPRPRQDAAGAGARAGEQAALCAVGRKRRRQSVALPRRGFRPRRQYLSQSRAAVGGGSCRSSRSRMVRRPRAAPTRPDYPTTSSWCAAAPAPFSPDRRC